MYKCIDCGVDTQKIDEYYIVHNWVWNEAMPMTPINAIYIEDGKVKTDVLLRQGKGMLCIGCLERRLRRKLTKKDFLDCPVNTDNKRWPKSKRLRKRMKR